MLTIPSEFQSTISAFSVLFTKPTFDKAKQLLCGAILCPGSRTVCNVLRTIGESANPYFTNFHRVLNRCRWSALRGAVLLVGRLLHTFIAPGATVAFGVDETIERRRGSCISKKGIYRDPVRSSQSHFVKCSGLRWMSLMLLCPLPWLKDTQRWALPFLTALCPSKRYYEHRPGRTKKLTDWARQMLYFLARYVKPFYQQVILVGDGSYATYELMNTAQDLGISLIGRMKFNARLFHLPKPKPKGRRGRQALKGERILDMKQRLTDGRINWQSIQVKQWYGQQGDKELLLTSGVSVWDRNNGQRATIRWVLVKDPSGQLDPALFGASDIDLSAEQVVQNVVHRWGLEVTFHEGRRHLGLESQRQWTDLAIERTTPVLLALKSIVCLLAKPLNDSKSIKPNRTAWYPKSHICFTDVLTAVRRRLWPGVELPTREKKGLVGNLNARIRFLYQTLALAVA